MRIMSDNRFRHFFFGPSRRKTRTGSRSVILQVEGLEEKRTPVNASWSVADGVLRITGSGAPFNNDRILVRQSNGMLAVFDARGTPTQVRIVGSPSDVTE